MKKKLPTLKTDKEAEDFVAHSDLTEYDLSGLVPMRFEFQPKNTAVNLRLPQQLLDAVRKQAKKLGIPYQRYIRMALERVVEG